ncbi:DNA-directed primase/polymerase protein [Balamuthia mandrillaris]
MHTSGPPHPMDCAAGGHHTGRRREERPPPPSNETEEGAFVEPKRIKIERRDDTEETEQGRRNSFGLPVITPKVFYGRQEKKVVTGTDLAWQRRLLRLRRPVQSLLKEFPKQDQAFRCCDKLNAEEVSLSNDFYASRLHVFAVEQETNSSYSASALSSPSSASCASPASPAAAASPSFCGFGARSYVVASYKQFWKHYLNLSADKRRHYELIREKSPCKLYFDIEFMKESNLHLLLQHPDTPQPEDEEEETETESNTNEKTEDKVKEEQAEELSKEQDEALEEEGNKMVEMFLNFVMEELRLRYPSCFASCHRHDFIILSSSTPSKFSRHIILNSSSSSVVSPSASEENLEEENNQQRERRNGRKKKAIEYCNGLEGQNNNSDEEEEKEKEDREERKHCITHQLPFFQDNIHCGNFVRILLNKLQVLRKTRRDVDRLFVRNERGDKETFFVDMGVYSRNRNFRMAYSSKVGKNRPLLPLLSSSRSPSSSSAATPPSDSREEQKEDEALFLASLVCNIGPAFNLNPNQVLWLTCYEEETRRYAPLEPWNDSAAASSSPLSTSSHLHSPSLLPITTPAIPSTTSSLSFRSAFPDVDSFIQEELNKRPGNHRGTIRSCVLFEDRKLLLYNIANNRFCENIGREHKVLSLPLLALSFRSL